jgi:hypothetical protein
MGVALCTLGFSLRAYIRIACFRHLLPEDYLMLLSLVILIGFSIMTQIHLADIYFLNHLLRGYIPPGISFVEIVTRASTALKTEGASLVLFVIGIDLIKLNFLVFFYRIGNRIQTYLVLWWVGFVLVLGCGVIGLGIIPYHCVMDDPVTIFANCRSGAFEKYQSDVNKASVAIDVISDAVGPSSLPFFFFFLSFFLFFFFFSSGPLTLMPQYFMLVLTAKKSHLLSYHDPMERPARPPPKDHTFERLLPGRSYCGHDHRPRTYV